MMILPPPQKYIDIHQLGRGPYIRQTETGRMNRKVFFFWPFDFYAEMSQYRLLFPQNLRDKSVLLVLDGHLSRLSWEAVSIFRRYNVELVVFPGHISHLLQSFDVAVASPPKNAYHKLIAHEWAQLEKQWKEQHISIHHVRYPVCRAFLRAYSPAIIS
jgi:hypothetical protein